jgi:hypothetical protein
MYVPTASHADPAGEPSLLGLSYRLVCPIDNRDDKTKMQPPLICSMQERIHRTMGQRDNRVLSDGYGHDATGQLGTELGGLPAAMLGECAPPDAPSTIAPLHVGTVTRKSNHIRAAGARSPSAPIRAPNQHVAESLSSNIPISRRDHPHPCSPSAGREFVGLMVQSELKVTWTTRQKLIGFSRKLSSRADQFVRTR